MGVVYGLIKEYSPKLAGELHSSSLPKPFTFSWLHGKPKRVLKEGILVDENTPMRMILSSWLDEVVEAISVSPLNKDEILINGVAFEAVKMKIYSPEISVPARFIALSPIVVSRGVKKNDKIYHEFLSPENPEFFERLAENLSKKYSQILKHSPGYVKIEPDHEYLTRAKTSKLVDIKGTKIRGHMLPLIVEGDEKLIKFGYYVGFGERTAQGFGCVEMR